MEKGNVMSSLRISSTDALSSIPIIIGTLPSFLYLSGARARVIAKAVLSNG